MQKERFRIALAVLMLFSVLLAGCSTDSGNPQAKQVSVEDRIKAIEARTDMPPQAKAMAISQLKANEGGSEKRGVGGQGSQDK